MASHRCQRQCKFRSFIVVLTEQNNKGHYPKSKIRYSWKNSENTLMNLYLYGLRHATLVTTNWLRTGPQIRVVKRVPSYERCQDFVLQDFKVYQGTRTCHERSEISPKDKHTTTDVEHVYSLKLYRTELYIKQVLYIIVIIFSY